MACPVCNGDLELDVEKENKTEIVVGSLYCPKCDVKYPIDDAIPNLLPHDQGDQVKSPGCPKGIEEYVVHH